MTDAKRAPRLGWVLALVVALAALVAACAAGPAARFPHRLHLTELACNAPGKPACLTCNTCHAASQPTREYKLPGADACGSCHQRDAAKVEATLSLVPPRISGEISMDHAQHLAMPEIRGQCVKCHAGVVKAGESTLPSMASCFSCHEHEQQWAGAKCGPCHQAADLRRTTPRSFLQHDAAFMRRHGDVPPFEQTLCQTCHTQKDCQACHDVSQNLTAEIRAPEKLEGAFVHRGDFLTRHAIEAKASPARCSSCHTPDSCDSCHLQRGVSAGLRAPRNVHPPGWVSNNPGFTSLHGQEARRDVVACASCHEQGPATNCIRCHKVGGYGGNPHPRGWQSAREPSAEMCRYCHG